MFSARPRTSWQRDVFMSCLRTAGCTFKRPKRTKRYQCTESLLGLTLQERLEHFNSLHLGDKIFIEEYFHAMKVQCCCVTLF